MPSRDFLVRQAVLNAVAAALPHLVAGGGIAASLSVMTSGGQAFCAGSWLPRATLREFNKLVARYNHA